VHFFAYTKKTWEASLPKNTTEVNQRIIEVRKALGLNQKDFAERIKVSRSYMGVLEATDREVNERILSLVCVNCGVNEKWLRNGMGKMFKEKHNPRLDKVIRDFEKLDDYLQEYVIKQLDILLECQEQNKKKK
jgi:transcriptional regulator with XRE-family HTH domain